MVKLGNMKWGLIIGIVIIVIVIITSMTYFYYTSDIESDNSSQDDNESDVGPEIIDELYLEALVKIRRGHDLCIASSWNRDHRRSSILIHPVLIQAVKANPR